MSSLVHIKVSFYCQYHGESVWKLETSNGDEIVGEGEAIVMLLK